jgi:glycine/D-amino acid oxidase-like deaminating enzyme
VDVVVAGGGIVGASVALGLAQLGKSVLVLEQNTLTSGSTWHAAGLVAQLKHCEAMMAMAKYSSDMFVDLEAGDSPIGWHQTGSLGLARGAEHWEQMQRATQMLKDAGVAFEVIHLGGDAAGEARLREIHPLLRPVTRLEPCRPCRKAYLCIVRGGCRLQAGRAERRGAHADGRDRQPCRRVHGRGEDGARGRRHVRRAVRRRRVGDGGGRGTNLRCGSTFLVWQHLPSMAAPS